MVSTGGGRGGRNTSPVGSDLKHPKGGKPSGWLDVFVFGESSLEEAIINGGLEDVWW